MDEPARITVAYAEAVPPEARAAFDFAVAKWSRLLRTPVEIRIRVGWIVGNGPTGFALPNWTRGFEGVPRSDVTVASALADAIAGRDLQPGADDMNVFFKETDDWYFGTDGRVPAEKTDFVTSAMHEIGHGLGISTSAFVPWEGDPVASLGMPNEYLDFFDWSFELPTLDGTPTIYDAMIVDPDGRHVIDTNVFPNPSAALYDALKGPLFFDGDQARAVNGGEPLRVDSGSVSHLSREGLQEADADWQMAPDTGVGVAQHDPGPRTLAILRDLGWTLADAG